MSELLNTLRAARAQEDLHAMSRAVRAINEARPELGGSWGEVCSLAMDAGDDLAALSAARSLTEALPSNIQSWLWLATVQSRIGDHSGVIKTLQPHYDENPHDGELNRRLGRALLALGGLDKARQAFSLAIAADPHDVLAWEGLAQSKTFESGDDDLAQMEEVRLQLGEDTPAEQRGILSYAIAKAYEDMGELDIAMRRVGEGAAFYRTAAPFDVDAHENMAAHLLSAFDEALEGAGQGAGRRDDRPVFIIAPPGAGGEILALALGAADNAACLPRENGLFWMAAATLGEHTLELIRAALDHEGEDNPLTIVGDNYLAYAGEWLGDSRKFIDPSTLNELSAGAAGFALPEARFIRLTRDRRDLAWSIFKRRFPKARHWTYHPDDIARVLAIHDRVCARWETLFGDRTVTLSYEDFAADPAAVIARAAAHAGLEMDERLEEAARFAAERLRQDAPGQAERFADGFGAIDEALSRASHFGPEA